jgi:hypothetical protein
MRLYIYTYNMIMCKYTLYILYFIVSVNYMEVCFDFRKFTSGHACYWLLDQLTKCISTPWGWPLEGWNMQECNRVNKVVLTYISASVGCLRKEVTSVHGYEQDKSPSLVSEGDLNMFRTAVSLMYVCLFSSTQSGMQLHSGIVWSL